MIPFPAFIVFALASSMAVYIVALAVLRRARIPQSQMRKAIPFAAGILAALVIYDVVAGWLYLTGGD